MEQQICTRGGGTETIGQESSSVLALLMMGDSVVIIGVIGNFVIRLDETTGLWQIHLGRALLMLPLIAGAILIWRIFSYRKLLSRIEDLCPG